MSDCETEINSEEVVHNSDTSPDNPTVSPYYFGAVYYRKSNPPEAEWERDYATAVMDGRNVLIIRMFDESMKEFENER